MIELKQRIFYENRTKTNSWRKNRHFRSSGSLRNNTTLSNNSPEEAIAYFKYANRKSIKKYKKYVILSTIIKTVWYLFYYCYNFNLSNSICYWCWIDSDTNSNGIASDLFSPKSFLWNFDKKTISTKNVQWKSSKNH